MSSAEAFLQQLTDHPDDDTTRFVYADWLEEQGDPRSDYLRAEVELASLDENDPRYGSLAERLTQLRQGIAEDWLKLAGKRFDVWLLGYIGELKITLIKVIRELTGVGLKEAKAMSEALPCVIVADRPRHEAEAGAKRLQDPYRQGWSQAEGKVRVSIRVAQRPKPDAWRVGAVYEVVLNSIAPSQKISAIKVVRAITGRGLAECKGIVESLPQVIATKLTHAHAQQLLWCFANVGWAEIRVVQSG